MLPTITYYALPIVLLVVLITLFVLWKSIYSIGPTQVGLVRKRFERDCRTTIRLPSTKRLGIRPSC
jgi:hypothetical protein